MSMAATSAKKKKRDAAAMTVIVAVCAVAKAVLDRLAANVAAPIRTQIMSAIRSVANAGAVARAKQRRLGNPKSKAKVRAGRAIPLAAADKPAWAVQGQACAAMGRRALKGSGVGREQHRHQAKG